VAELQVRNVRLDFASTPVLRGVDLTVESGSLLALLGPSGCGKTTLLRSIAGFLRPSSGEISVAGQTVSAAGIQVPAHQRHIGIVPQDGALFPQLTVAKNIGFGLPRRLVGRKQRIEEMLGLVGLSALAQRMPAELSGGQQQRVALARALAPAPRLVLLDEPFSALDANLRVELRADVQRVLRAARVTAILVTHDQQEALSVADQVAVMIEGQVRQCGSPHEVYRQPASIEVGSFVGEAMILTAENQQGIARTAIGDIPLLTPKPAGPGTVLVRPEQVMLSPAGSGQRARITRIQYFGHDALVDCELPGKDPTHIQARCSESRCAELLLAVDRGQEVYLSIAGPGVFFPAPAGESGPGCPTLPAQPSQ
jgi:iron(III) transport system ATP-binding protein